MRVCSQLNTASSENGQPEGDIHTPRTNIGKEGESCSGAHGPPREQADGWEAGGKPLAVTKCWAVEAGVFPGGTTPLLGLPRPPAVLVSTGYTGLTREAVCQALGVPKSLF